MISFTTLKIQPFLWSDASPRVVIDVEYDVEGACIHTFVEWDKSEQELEQLLSDPMEFFNWASARMSSVHQECLDNGDPILVNGQELNFDE